MNWFRVSLFLSAILSFIFIILTLLISHNIYHSAYIGNEGISGLGSLLRDGSGNLDTGILMIVGSTLASAVAAIGTLSGVYFGWRKDRRDAAEAKLNSEELALKIRELEKKLNEAS